MIRRTAIALIGSVAVLGGAPTMGQSDKNLVEVAQEAGDFTTLLAAAEAAGLVETLTGEGPFTLFAPTDAAFGDLPEGTVDSLLLSENQDQLTRLLSLHVVPRRVMSAELSDGTTLTSLEGSDLTIGTEGGVTVDGVAVSTPDVEASNGVIHIVDAVILPQTM